MFGSALPRAAWIVGLAVGALGLAVAVGATAAYLVSPSYDERSADERSADERPPVVSVATRTYKGAPAARDARAATTPHAQANLGERTDGAGSPPSTSATATANASATATASASATAMREAAMREAAMRDNDPPSRPNASADRVGRAAAATATASASATAPAKPPAPTWRSWWWRSWRVR